MRRQLDIDHAIAALATRQAGVVARIQLLRLGLSASAIDRRLRAGRLHPIHRGVYAVGHRRLGVDGRRWAAVLACGEGAVLSDVSAGAGWGLRASASPTLHVTVRPGGGRARHEGIRIHRRTLAADEVTTLDGLPITTPARTLLDLAATGLRGRRLEAALDHAERRLRVDWAEVRRIVERHAGRPGAPALRDTLARYAPGTVDTFSELEEIVLELCDEYGFPRPHVNRMIEGKRRDFSWPGTRLIVEADSYTWHRSPSALDDDRERDVRLTLAGYVPLRFTYKQCTERRAYVRAAILQGLLEHRPGAAVASGR
jgi:very-short-patch-repair endonuclease